MSLSLYMLLTQIPEARNFSLLSLIPFFDSDTCTEMQTFMGVEAERGGKNINIIAIR